MTFVAIPGARPALATLAVPAPGAMDPQGQLHKLLSKNGVDPQVIAYLGKAETEGGLQLTTLANFANAVDSGKDVDKKLLEGSPKRGSINQLSRLKQAWREAEAEVKRALKRQEEGMEDFDYDEPLGAPEKEVVDSNFLKAYGWPKALDPRRMGCDTLLGRVYREFVRLTMTLYAVSNVKVLAQARKGQPAKKHHVHSRLSFETHEPGEDPDVGAPGVRVFLEKLEALTNTWAVAGCYDVEFPPHGAGGEQGNRRNVRLPLVRGFRVFLRDRDAH